MTVIVNPFAGSGFTLAEMTAAIQQLPNRYGRVGELGLFASEPISQRTVVIESVDGELRLLPSVQPGAPATVGTSEQRTLRSFVVPHIPHNDVILPAEVQGVRGFGAAANEDPLVTVMTRKLARMRAKHAQTLEYMRVNALLGVTKDGAGNVLYDWHTAFGLTKKSVDFKFAEDKDLVIRCTQVARQIEENLKGEMMTSIHALVSPEFFDKLVTHTSVEKAYTFAQGTAGTNPLKDDVRRGFRFGSILFEEYFGTVTLSTGDTVRLIPEKEGIAFPLGTFDTFRTYFAPANLMEAVGTYGQELYAHQLARPNGTGVDIYTQSNPLPIVKRPALTVRLFSSNGW